MSVRLTIKRHVSSLVTSEERRCVLPRRLRAVWYNMRSLARIKSTFSLANILNANVGLLVCYVFSP